MDKLTAAQVFITIVDKGSMSAAAENLSMSRAMVTRYLAEMENWAGVRLLNRTTRTLSLTSSGESVYQHAKQLALLAQKVPIEQTEAKSTSGVVRISCSQSLANSALSVAVSEFLAIYPNMAIDMQISNQSSHLIEDRIDLAIRITNNLHPNMIARPLSTCYSVICASPRYLQNKDIPQQPGDLARHNCLTYNYFGRSLWQFEKQGEMFTVPVSGRLSANESTVIAEAALQGIGIAMQPYYSVAHYLESGKLVKLLTDYQPIPMGIYGVYVSRQNQPMTLRVLLDFLVDWFEHSPYWLNLVVQDSI